MPKTILIIGANRGLGLEFARQFSARGDRVLATCRAPDNAEELVELVGADAVVPLEVTNADSIAAAFATVSAKTPKLDLLLHNSGIGGHFPLEAVTPAQMMQFLEVNSVAPLFVFKAFMPLLEAADEWACAAFVSSLIGSIEHKPQLYKGGFPYSTSKAALNMIIRYLSLEVQPKNIATVALSPGWVRTDMGGPEAVLSPEESIGGMIKVLDGMSMEKTGTYWHYDGTTIPW